MSDIGGFELYITCMYNIGNIPVEDYAVITKHIQEYMDDSVCVEGEQ